MTDGFEEFFAHFGWDEWQCPADYRARHMISFMQALARAGG